MKTSKKLSLGRVDVEFIEIQDDENKKIWLNNAMNWHDLSGFYDVMLRKVGDAIRGPKSQHFWSNGCYCWYTDERQSVEECVYLTTSGNVVYQQITAGKLFHILFNK